MRPGREMDALVARKVLGHTVYQATAMGHDVLLDRIDPKYELFLSTDHGWAELPEYSTDIAAAWQVVEKMRLSVEPWNADGWLAWQPPAQGWYCPADTAPLAICRAALKAVGVEVDT